MGQKGQKWAAQLRGTPYVGGSGVQNERFSIYLKIGSVDLNET